MTLKTVPDLFRRYRAKETGHWRVGSEFTRTIYLDSGDIVFASSNHPSDRLTVILVENGKLTQNQMDHALANLKPGISIGKNLIEMGFITQKDLLDAARLQVERIVWSALTTSESPVFDSKNELEGNIVRLPLDTASLLFTGVMKITDRESLLELLGPLNQVVLLQGKRLFELELPADLAKMPPFMDGTHTILEISNEASVEPIRTGAFALFLREMGWGKLFELPPLDRQAITRALDTPDPTKPPSAIPSPRSQLFTIIEEAARPTTNLEHLSSMLDEIAPVSKDNKPTASTVQASEEPLPQLQTLPEPMAPEPINSSEERPELEFPTKSVGRVLPFPSEPDPYENDGIPQEPSIKISMGNSYEDEKIKSPLLKKKKAAGGLPKQWLYILIVLGVAIALTVAARSLWKIKASKTESLDMPELNNTPAIDEPVQIPVQPPPEKPKPVETESVQPPPPAIQEPTPKPTLPPPATEKNLDLSREARFQAIVDGNFSTAQEQGIAFQASLPKTTWTVRLLVACDGANIRRLASSLGALRPELFLMPIRLRDGRMCYQLFEGRLPNKNAATAEEKKLLNALKENKVDLQSMQVNTISTAQKK